MGIEIFWAVAQLNKINRENPSICSNYSHMKKGPFVKPMRYGGGIIPDFVCDIPGRPLPREEESILVKAIKKYQKRNSGESFTFRRRFNRYFGEVVDMDTFRLSGDENHKYLVSNSKERLIQYRSKGYLPCLYWGGRK